MTVVVVIRVQRVKSEAAMLTLCQRLGTSKPEPIMLSQLGKQGVKQ